MTKIAAFIAGRTPPELYETYLTPGLFAPWAVEMAAFAKPGHRCLDIACGTGAVSRALATRLGDAAAIAAVDVAPPMIVTARAAPFAEIIDYQVASADALPFGDGVFDRAFCQQGAQFFPDKKRAFDEIWRVLKPGGLFIASVWRNAEDCSPVFESFENAVARHLGEDLVPFGPFSFGDSGELRTLAEEAGFVVDRLETQTKTAKLPSVSDLVLFDVLFLGRAGEDGSLQPVLSPDDPAGDEVIDRIIADMTEDLTEYLTSDGVLTAPMTANVLLARK